MALHCSLAQGAAWAGLAARLPGLTITAPDLPGHGRSPDWDGVADLHRLTTDAVLALMTGPCDLIGHSFGATVALRVALERPDLVRTLTLVEPVLFAAARMAGDPAHAAFLAGHAGFAALWAAGDRAGAAAAFHADWGGGEALADLPAHLRAYIVARMGLILAAHPALEEDTGGLLAPGRLERLAMPVLLVEGDRSPAVIGAIQRALAARLGDVRRLVVAGAGHMVPISHPGPVASGIAALLAGVEA
jgi:pimeloyl-ACP methyl ester carboxylesterase